MKLNIIISLLIFIGCSDKSTDPNIESKNTFFPLSIGNKWNYEYKESSGGDGEGTTYSGDLSFSVVNSDIKTDTTFYSFKVIKKGKKIETSFIPGTYTQKHDTTEFYNEYDFNLLNIEGRLFFRDDLIELNNLSEVTAILIDVETEDDTLTYRNLTGEIGIMEDEISLVKKIGIINRYYHYSRTFWNKTIRLKLITYSINSD